MLGQAVGKAVEIGLAAGGEIDPFGIGNSGPGEQCGKGVRVVEEAVEVGSEDLPIVRQHAIGAAAGEAHGRPCQRRAAVSTCAQ